MARKLISVIIPFYNRIWLCEQSVQSVLAQTYRNFEIILVNDGSTEDTATLQEMAKHDHRIRYFQQENAGKSAARNKGIDNAEGEYIAFLDADDLWKPQKLQKQLKFMEKNHLFFSHTSYECISTDGMLLSQKHAGRFSGNVFPDIVASCPVATPTVMVRSEVFKNGRNRFDSRYRISQDVCLWVDMSRQFEFGGIDEILASVRLGPLSASKDLDKQIEGLTNIMNHCLALPETQQAKEEIAKVKVIIDRFSKEKEHPSATVQLHSVQAQNWDHERSAILRGGRYLNLQVSDADIQGERFNGHRLHYQLQARGIRSMDIVTYKQSDDPDTLLYTQDNGENFAEQIINSREFILSDIVHLHLIHNTDFDLNWLPMMSQLKPIVLTLHDPFFMGGHCVHPFDCNLWQTQCRDCPYPSICFPMSRDTSAFSFTQKRIAFQQSPITLVVASDWMLEKVRRSPILQNKKTYRLPFGVDQTIFKPGDRQAARKALGIPDNGVVLLLRPKKDFKGSDIAREAIQKLGMDIPVTVLAVGDESESFGNLGQGCRVIPMGWVNDEQRIALLYQACDILLMPSRMESFGLMAIEAMSCARTVLAITGEGTALPDVIHSPECGIAVEEDRYAETLKQLCLHPEMLKAHGKKSYDYAREHYGETQYIDGITKIYQETMDRHQPIENEDVILYQMLKSNAHSVQSPQLFLSRSWQITQPLRAVMRAKNALIKKKSVAYAMHVFQDECKHIDRDCNIEILNSTSWKFTYPIRLMGRLKRTLQSLLHGGRGSK